MIKHSPTFGEFLYLLYLIYLLKLGVILLFSKEIMYIFHINELFGLRKVICRFLWIFYFRPSEITYMCDPYYR